MEVLADTGEHQLAMREWEPILSIPLPFPSSPNVSNVKPILSPSLSPTLSLSPFSLFQMSPMLKSIYNQIDPNEQFKKSIGRPHFPTCTHSTNFPQVVSVKSGVSQHKSCLHRLATTGKHSSGDCVQLRLLILVPLCGGKAA